MNETYKCRKCGANIIAVNRPERLMQNESITAVNSKIKRVKQRISIDEVYDYAEDMKMNKVSIINYVTAECNRCNTTTTKKIVIDVK